MKGQLHKINSNLGKEQGQEERDNVIWSTYKHDDHGGTAYYQVKLASTLPDSRVMSG